MAANNNDEMTPRPASTLALVRNTLDGVEVLMLQRTHQAAFLPGFYVFPGGAVDPSDQHPELDEVITGHNDTSASALMGIDHNGIGYLVAAIRESFEEAGILLAQTSQGEPVNPNHPLLANARLPIANGDTDLLALCREHDLKLPLDRIGYIDHWVTPPGPPRRFDTRFFVAAAPDGQTASHDGEETIDHCWLSPAQALADHQSGERLFGAPTLSVLRRLARFRNCDEILADAMQQTPTPFPTEPWPAQRQGDIVSVAPGQPAYSEVRKLDPRARGTAHAEIRPGHWVQLSDTVSRLTVPNPGMMTGPGTNTYLIETDEGAIAIDPGPDHSDHLQALLERLEGQTLRYILVTHTHKDHSPGARALKAATGATLWGIPAPADGLQDTDFSPEQIPVDGERLQLGTVSLKALHTPGHASNHLCFLHEQDNILFSGDHIMQGSTVVINPPDGDMADYLTSLNRLLGETIEWIAPGHGFLMAYPDMVVDFLVSHRLGRERKVIDALNNNGPGTLADLTPHAYADVSPALHPVASRSLLAHLIKLQKDGRAAESDGTWQLIR